MKNRKYYENLFADYPSVVTLTQFRGMLGGIGDSTARKLMRENRVKHYYIRMTYLIPKDWVIDYVLSEHYAEYKEQLKVQVWPCPSPYRHRKALRNGCLFLCPYGR